MRAAQRTPGPSARMLKQGVAQTEWHITMGDGRQFTAMTYRGSNLVYLQNLKGRRVRGVVIEREARAAIAKAAGQQGGTP